MQKQKIVRIIKEELNARKRKTEYAMKGQNDLLAPLQGLNLMDDFLHYVERSSDESIAADCDSRLMHLHDIVKEIKASEQMGVKN